MGEVQPQEAKTLPCVYLDTTVLKSAVDRFKGCAPTEQRVTWGLKTLAVTAYVPAAANAVEETRNEKLKGEARLLPKIAELARAGRIRLLVQDETLFEFWGLPRTHDPRGMFYGAPIEHVEPPLRYGRVVVGGFRDEDPKHLQYDFLAQIRHRRFIKLQRACGAYQGQKRPPRNPLLDSFHIWCAEHASADYFLTCDFTLVEHLRQQPKYVPTVRVVTPSELLDALLHGREPNLALNGPRRKQRAS